VVTELVNSGKLWDHLNTFGKKDKESPIDLPEMDLEVDQLVKQAQKLLASVNRTLEKSAAQNKAEKRGRSKSVLPRRYSSDVSFGYEG